MFWKFFVSILVNQSMENVNNINTILHINFSFKWTSNRGKTNRQNAFWQEQYLIDNIEKGNT